MNHESLKVQISGLLNQLRELEDELDSELDSCNNRSTLIQLLNDLDSAKTILRAHKFKLKQSKTGLKLV